MSNENLALVADAVRLISELAELEVSIRIDDDRVIVDDPHCRMTVMQMERLKQQRYCVERVLLSPNWVQNGVSIGYLERVWSDTPRF